MNGKYRSTIGVLVVLGGLLCGNAVVAQDAPDAPLADQLKKEIKLTKMGTDSTGTSVTDAGTVLVLKKGGVYGVPQSTAVIVAPSTFKDNELHQPGLVQRSMILKISKLLTVDEKVYVTKIDVKQKEDKVVLTITECDKCNNVQDPSSYKGAIQFQFPKGYLEKADAGQVADVIHQVPATTGCGSGATGRGAGEHRARHEPERCNLRAGTTGKDGESREETDLRLQGPENHLCRR
jgi:hypothetical protein